MATFTKENCADLKSICEKIISLVDENVEGDLMLSQKMVLGDRIKEFGSTPIVKDSGILKTVIQ